MAVACIAYAHVLSRLPASRTASFLYLVPAVALLVGVAR
jgi:drug/metabolite transporter (DMT)-like permease